MDRSKEAVDGGLVAIEESTTTMDEAAHQVSDVNEKMREITSILGQQKTASAEIAESIGGVATLAQESKSQVTCISDMISNSNDQMTQSAGTTFQSGNDRSLCEMAKVDHIVFKKRVMDAVMGRVELHAGDIPDHHNCRLGKWYDSVQQAEITGLPAFEILIAPHELVHAAAKRALEAHDSGDEVAAMNALEEMNTAGSEVVLVLNRLSDALEQVEKKAHESKAAA